MYLSEGEIEWLLIIVAVFWLIIGWWFLAAVTVYYLLTWKSNLFYSQVMDTKAEFIA